MSDTKDLNKSELLKKAYGNETEAEYAIKGIQQINNDLDLREKASLVFNGVPYSQAYEYNQEKALGYSPPKGEDDEREVSYGLIHEKIISFISIFLKYVWKRRIKCYDEQGNLVKGMGKIYDLGIEYSYQLEEMKKKIALVYWEVYTQGNAFVLEDWEVRMENIPDAYLKGELVDPVDMDYTYEFLDNLKYKEGKDIQTRRAISIVMDGRQVIFGNPEIDYVQDQPRITIEELITRADAEAMFGTLKRWKAVPEDLESILEITGEKVTLFDKKRHEDPANQCMVHRTFDREKNRMNIFVNGVMMLPSDTPMTIFYPRGNYPISNVAGERLRGSIYARSIPAKTKFNADYIDWVLKQLAYKFEQGVTPAILAKGKYTLTKDIFKAGNVTHGVDKSDFERADPENKGITNPEFNFMNLIKQTIEAQTVNQSFNGELSNNATATEIATVDSNQNKKLALMLDGLVNGFTDMALRRAETIEAKYTIKQKETIVDGKTVPVYQNFTINVSGIENVVEFNEDVGRPEFDERGKKSELFEKSFKSKKLGIPSEFYVVNPEHLRNKRYKIVMEIIPEQIKDSQLQMIQMFDEFSQLVNLFGMDKAGGDISSAQL